MEDKNPLEANDNRRNGQIQGSSHEACSKLSKEEKPVTTVSPTVTENLVIDEIKNDETIAVNNEEESQFPTNSIISTPFLYGGEIQLPNIMNAFVVGGKNLVQAIEMCAIDWMTGNLSNPTTPMKPFCDEARNTQPSGTKPTTEKAVQMKMKEDASTGPGPSSVKKTEPRNKENNGRYHEESNVQKKESIYLHPVETNIDLLGIKKASRIGLSDIPVGVSGFREALKSKSQKVNEEKDFIDYFAAKDASKYIAVLEKLEIDFQKRISMEMKNASKAFQEESFVLARKITSITKIKTVDEEKELQEYDFPLVIEHDASMFGIEITNNINALHKTHNYGVKFLHWFYLLQREITISPKDIYKIAIELLADIMIQCYAIFARIGEYLACLVDQAKLTSLNHPSIDKVLYDLRNLVDTISDELGAIGKSFGQVMIRIPNLPRQLVVETMTKLYLQVNYGNIAITRAMEAFVPILIIISRLQN